MDKWSGEVPLKDRFPNLFDIANFQMSTVAQVCGARGPLSFRRSLDPQGRRDWQQLRGIIDQTILSQGQDGVSWSLEPSGCFSVRSMYLKLSQGASIAHFRDVWAARIPLKIKIFSWQLALDKLPTAINIAARRGPGNGCCKLCDVDAAGKTAGSSVDQSRGGRTKAPALRYQSKKA
ncbi:uncharacterized protein [Lolium perenne]|uniref:uncharacterized protein n=1 Tax=Lolium perenne TaxID=4522 RepID=UPI0021F6474F|nr:uncharacterized protein LOC127347857 [Lolium perenne]